MSSVDLADIQGNILRGYRKPRVRYLLLEVGDRTAAHRWLADSISGGVPQITTQAPWTTKPETCFNIGVTFEGLRALGTPAASLDTFPAEFREGMSDRSGKLGDIGPSAPQHWPSPFDQPKRLHLVATIYAQDIAQLDGVQQQCLAGQSGLTLLGKRDGWNFHGNYVHFGYHDNISQPRFEDVYDPERHADGQPIAPLGTVLLGHPTNFDGLRWQVPQPRALGHNGSFNAFRVLKQDVVGFETYLDRAAAELLAHPAVDEVLAPGTEAKIGAGLSRYDAMREVVAANLCGRWRNGVPLAVSPDTPQPRSELNRNDFDYDASSRCPYGAHVRRCNPRGGQIVQRVANHSRRLVRRGMPYGPPYDPTTPDTEERGLLGNFIGASLGAQFEAMSCDWLNLGLQDPRITGSNDPVVGSNETESSWFDMPLRTSRVIRLRGLPRFVETRGGAYTFLPSVSAIGFLASLNT